MKAILALLPILTPSLYKTIAAFVDEFALSLLYKEEGKPIRLLEALLTVK